MQSNLVILKFLVRTKLFTITINQVVCYLIAGWRHFVDNDISWTLFFKMGDFSWTFSKGDFSWTLLVTSRGQF